MRKSRFFSFLIFLGAPHHPVDVTSPKDCASALTQASMRRFIPRLMRGARRLLRRRAQRPGFRSEGGGASVAGLSTAAGLAAVAAGAVAGATEFWASAEPSAVDKEGWKMGTSAEDFEDKLVADLMTRTSPKANRQLAPYSRRAERLQGDQKIHILQESRH